MSFTTKADVEIAALLDAWDQKRGSRRLPPRSDFDFYECRRWLHHLSIVKIVEGPKIYLMTLHGTASVGYFKRDFTGQFLEDVFAERGMPWALDAYRHAHQTCEPVVMETEPFFLNGSARRMKRMILPLGQDDRVEHLMASIYPITGPITGPITAPITGPIS